MYVHTVLAQVTVQELPRHRVAKPEASAWEVLLGGRKSPEELHRGLQLLSAEQGCFPTSSPEGCGDRRDCDTI